MFSLATKKLLQQRSKLVLEKYYSRFKKIIDRRKDFGIYKVVKPGFVSEKLHVPQSMECPSYVTNVYSPLEEVPKEPEVKSREDIWEMRKTCLLARLFLDTLSSFIEVGITTDEIDKLVHSLCIEYNVYPSPLGYKGFPKSITTSVNNVACHGIPDDRPLEDGDIINIDLTIFANKFHGDCSITYPVGEVDAKGLHLIEATKQCLQAAIDICRDGEYFCSIGQVVSETARSYGYKVVPAFAGHGIGRYFHGPPDIMHCYNEYPGKMRSGMTFTIEPVLTQGEPEIIILEDGWTAVTADNARTAQFEHTVLVTDTGVEILTQSKLP